MSKHFEVYFINVEDHLLVMADELPVQMGSPLYIAKETGELSAVPITIWWVVTLLRVDSMTQERTPKGRIHINLDNVSFIREA